MMNPTLTALANAENNAVRTFGDNEEQAIISLAIDHPDFFVVVARFLKPEMFINPVHKYISAIILNAFEKHGVIPSRGILKDTILNNLTEDDDHEQIVGIVERKSDPREVPIIRDRLVSWAKKSAYGLLYAEQAQLAFHNNDFDAIENILKQAQRIADVDVQGLWLLENAGLVMDPQSIEHRTTGYPELDKHINLGGPSPKEVFVWMGGTNSGKSVLLCNNAITSWRGIGPTGKIGQDVLFVTFELDYIKTGMRCLGAMMEDIPLSKLHSNRDRVLSVISSSTKSYNGRIFIAELSPDECSVNNIYAMLDSMRRVHGWRPDVVILDYLDLMMSRVSAYNNNDYDRQKHVANEIRGFAKNENVLVFTATQTNRGDGNNNVVVDLNRAAESYGKQFSMDYVVTINQSEGELKMRPPQMRFFIAKNRNGPKHLQVSCRVNFETMYASQI